jgi:hypothetical protein
MKFFLPLFILIGHLLCAQNDGKIILEGNYLGENLYIQNPYAANGKSFCTKKVLVNGVEYPADSTLSSAYEIDLKRMNFKEGDSVRIEIFHSAGCKPKVINTQTHYHGKGEAVLNLRIEYDSILKWETVRERFNHLFLVQQYRWNKWINAEEAETGGVIRNWEEVKGTAKTKDTISYSVNIKKYLHSGKNQFRINSATLYKQNYSKTLAFQRPEGTKLKVEKNYKKLAVEFPAETLYEIYDESGSVVKRGFGRSVYINKLPKGKYFLNYDNETAKVEWY